MDIICISQITSYLSRNVRPILHIHSSSVSDWYKKQLGDTAACSKIMMEATKGIRHKYRKGTTEDCFIFGIFFSSKKSAEAVMEVGAVLIGMIKINVKGFCKETIESLTKEWPGGYHRMLRSKPMVPEGRQLIDFGHKYNTWKFLSFIIGHNVGSTQTDLPYLSKYPGQFSNFAIHPIALPLVIY